MGSLLGPESLSESELSSGRESGRWLRMFVKGVFNLLEPSLVLSFRENFTLFFVVLLSTFIVVA